MRLGRVYVSNFRSIGEAGVTLEFRQNLILLVGKNNSGKSNILDAIQLLLGPKNPRYVPVPPTDFHDPKKTLIIEAEFDGLDWGWGKRLGLSDAQCGALMSKSTARTAKNPGHLTLRLSIPGSDGGGRQTEEEADEDSDGAGKKEVLVLLANHTEVRRTEDLRKALVKLIAVPSVRDQSNILSPSSWTHYGRFLRDVLSGTDKADELASVIKQATDLLKSILSSEAEALSKAAKITAYVDGVDFQLTKEGEPAELLRNLALMVSYGGRTDEIARVGTGTQSAVILALLEICLRHGAKKGLRLFLVEEPELYLHPHAQRYVAALLRAVAAENENFVILTTHSPSIAAETDMVNVVRVDRTPDGGTTCRRVPEDYAGLERAERILTPETCEMFFAERVVLVEGESDSTFLRLVAPHVKDKTGESCDPNRRNVSFVRAGGKGSFGPYAELLKALWVQWRLLADLDAVCGSALAEFKKTAGLTGSEDQQTQIEALRGVGVCVLRNGEIEDYYGSEALGVLGGCTEEEAKEQVRTHRRGFDEPGALQLFVEMVTRNQQEIAATEVGRIPKLVGRWYDQSLDAMRKDGRVAETERKTGEALARWLKLPKPVIAGRVARWMVDGPDRMPGSVGALVCWLVAESLVEASGQEPKKRE